MSVRTRVIAVAMLFALLTSGGCAMQTPAPAGEQTAAPTGEQVDAVTNLKAFEGRKLNLLLISHSFVDSLQPLLPEFTEQTGIEVTTEVLAEQPGFEKLVSDLSSGAGTFDLFMTSPLNNWQYATAGWVEPLDAYLEDPAKTPADYDLADFAPEILNSNRWTLTPMSGIGEGELWALPINYETYLLAYRPSILAARGVAVPTTYEELLAAGPQLTFTGADGQQTYGVITRFDKYWDLPFLTFGTMLQSYGVQMVDENGELQICSPASVQATEDFIALLKSSSPAGRNHVANRSNNAIQVANQYKSRKTQTVLEDEFCASRF